MYKYSHGGNAIFEKGNDLVLDLSANINPLGMPDGVAEAIFNEIKNCTFYPDNYSTKLRLKISEFENISHDFIFCASGASDIIFRLPKAIRPKKAIVLAPTFSDYERSLKSFGIETNHYYLDQENGYKLDSNFIKKIENYRPDIIFICNPNNPTGVLTDIDILEEIIKTCKKINAMVIIDECFIDFYKFSEDYTCKRFLNEFENLIILKAFTKLFAMPGIRLGYAICSNKKLIEDLYFHGPDWAVSNIAQASGIAALSSADEFIKKTVAFVSEEMRYEKDELYKLGYNLFDSCANYIFLKNPYGFNLQEELNKSKIRIRCCDNYLGLNSSFFRIGISQKANNKRLIETIKLITRGYKL